MLTFSKKMIHRQGLVVALAFVFGLLSTGQISSQDEKTAKTSQAGKVAPAKTGSTKKKRYLLKPPPKNFSPPLSKVAEDVFDWGSVLQGEVVIHDFAVKNSGGAPLRIEKVKPSCGCTTVGGEGQVIAPGATGKITLKVDTKKFSGTIRKTAQISTNASKTTQTLTMTGKIETAVLIEPKLPRITVVRGVPIKPLTITLKKSSKNSFKLNKASSKSEVVSIEMKEIEADSSYELLVTPKLPDDTRKYHYAEIDANVTVKNKSFDLPVRVSITVKDRIEASPPSVYFSRRDTEKLDKVGGPLPTKELRIKSLASNHTFNITGVRLQGEHFKTRLSTITPGKEYALAVELFKKPKAGTRRVVEKILVATDDPTLKEIKINATASMGSSITRKSSTSKFTGGTSRPLGAKPQPAKPKVFGPVPPAGGGKPK